MSIRVPFYTAKENEIMSSSKYRRFLYFLEWKSDNQPFGPTVKYTDNT